MVTLPSNKRAGHQRAMTKKVVLAIHGGARIMSHSQLTSEKKELFCSTLRDALNAGYEILIKKRYDQQCNGTATVAVDAVEATVRCLEDRPLFNAGMGSVFRNYGKIRMDASIMFCPIKNCTPTRGKVSGCQRDEVVVRPNQTTQKRRLVPNTPKPQAGSVAGVENITNPISFTRCEV
jgi:isoaspartyl peptidase/L-asparaginase-like protein (Ntn-hydrolase superfamily)